MISRPQNGWVDITIGDWTDRASYLTDVELDFLDCLISVFENHSPACFSCDAEGWEYTIVVSENNIHIIEEKDSYEYYSYDFFDNNILFKDVAKNIYEDIYNNLDAWIVWEPTLDLNDMGTIDEYKEKIENKLDKLRKFLEE